MDRGDRRWRIEEPFSVTMIARSVYLSHISLPCLPSPVTRANPGLTRIDTALMPLSDRVKP